MSAHTLIRRTEALHMTPGRPKNKPRNHTRRYISPCTSEGGGKHRQHFGADLLKYENPMRRLVLPSHGLRQGVDEAQKFAVLPKSESQ
jgi:hypothetical protein